MPSVKIPKHNPDNDMTPFVDIAFLILTFFIMATQMKPPEPVEITTPHSVSTETLPETDAMMVEMDKDGRVFFTMLTGIHPEPKRYVIDNIDQVRNLGLTEAEKENFVKTYTVGVPFSQLKQYLSMTEDQRNKLNQPGIPIRDSANNELYYWVNAGMKGFTGKKVNYLIKGDNSAVYPDFKWVIDAFKRNDVFKFKLVTNPKDAPQGSELYRERNRQAAAASQGPATN